MWNFLKLDHSISILNSKLIKSQPKKMCIHHSIEHTGEQSQYKKLFKSLILKFNTMCPNCNVKVKSIEHKSKAYWEIKERKTQKIEIKIGEKKKTLHPNRT